MELYYHYTSIDGVFGIINSEYINATHIGYLNDPSEEEYFNKVLHQYLNVNEDSKKIYSALYNSSYENAYDSKEKYIISFSELTDALPMWNYYSEGNGYNIGFYLDKIIDRINSKIVLSSFKIKIIYDKNDQLQILEKFFIKYKEEPENINQLSLRMEECRKQNNEREYYNLEYELDNIIISFMEEHSVLKKSFKHPSYSNEREVRLIIEPDHQYENIFYRKTISGILVPYIKIPIKNREDIASITLHPLQSKLGKNGIMHFLKNKGIDLADKISISQIPFREI